MTIPIMVSNLSDATYNSSTGRIAVTSPNSTANGYQNIMELYSTPNILSCPKPGQLAILGAQANSQVQMIGYANSIIDDNYTISQGETSSFSDSWYVNTFNDGVSIQQAQSTNIENMMMGQSTNAVITDIITLLLEIVTYLGAHVHTGVTTGTDDTGPADPSLPLPDIVDITTDEAYIGGNENLAITGTYVPK